MQRLPRAARRAFGRWAAIGGGITLVVTGTVAPAPQSPQPRVEIETAPVPALPGGGAAATVSAPLAAELVALEWEADGEAAVEVRVPDRDGDGWTPWTRLEPRPDEGPDPGSPEDTGRNVAGPVWVGNDVRTVQVRTAEGRPRDVKLHAISSEDGRDQRWSAPTAAAFPDQPPVITREQWGADESLRTFNAGCDGDASYASNVRNAFVHHTVSVNTYGPDEADDLIRGIYAFHVRSNGWCDIGYNFLVDRYGRVYEGRFGGIDRAVIGAHAGGFNTGSTGVALLGDFSGASVPSAMYGAARAFLTWKLAFHGVDPVDRLWVESRGSSRYKDGAPVHLPTVAGHRDVSLTACPGDLAYSILGRLRSDVQAAILKTPPYPLPGWNPVDDDPSLVTVSAWGGVYPAGGQDETEQDAYWPGWAIAKSATRSTGAGGYVLDAYGGLHPFGGAPRVDAGGYWPGFPIGRDVTSSLAPGSGYVLDGWGGIHPYGAAPRPSSGPYWPGFDIGRAIATDATGTKGYVLDGWGGIHPFGGARPVTEASGYWPGWDIARDIVLRPDGRSGYVLDGFGGLHPFGGAPALAVSRYTAGRDEARGVVLDEGGTGGWVVDADGRLSPVGDAEPVTQSFTYVGTKLGRAVVLADSPPSAGSARSPS